MRRRAAGPVGATIPEGGGVCAAGTTAEAAAAGRLEVTRAEGDNEAGLRLTGRDIDMVHATESNNRKNALWATTCSGRTDNMCDKIISKSY